MTEPSEEARINNLIQYNQRQLKFLRSLPASPVTDAAIAKTQKDLAEKQQQLKQLQQQ